MQRWIAAAVLAACRAAPITPPAPHSDPPVPVAPVAPVVEVEDAGSDAEAAVVEQMTLPGDAPTSFVRGRAGTSPHIVFMPGLCSNAYAYLLAFPEAARAHGGVVAIEGDQPCGDLKGFRSFTWSASLQRARVLGALAAVGVAKIPDEGLTLVGYSSGASIAELMHHQWPDVFSRLVLIAPPIDPDMEHLRNARAVTMMSCSLDVPYRMKAAASHLQALEIPSVYSEMPGCTHGQIASGDEVFGAAFDWLESHGRVADDFSVRIEQTDGAGYATDFSLKVDATGALVLTEAGATVGASLSHAKLEALDTAITRARFFSRAEPECHGTVNVQLAMTVRRDGKERSVHEPCAFAPLWLSNLGYELRRVVGVPTQP